MTTIPSPKVKAPFKPNNVDAPVRPDLRVGSHPTFDDWINYKYNCLKYYNKLNFGNKLGNSITINGVTIQKYDTGAAIIDANFGQPNAALFELHGGIFQKWEQLGELAFGYPVTDESVTPDGMGKFNHFSEGGSIYWTPATGAHEVHGAIRELWSSLGWERSSLGYPVSDEMPAGDNLGRISNFQNGSIYWSPATGAFIVQNSLTFQGDIVFSGDTALGGNVKVSMNNNGDVVFSGHLHDSGALSYDVAVAVVVLAADGTPYAFTKNAHTGGTFSPDSRDVDWNLPANNQLVTAHWYQIQKANFQCQVASQDTLIPVLQTMLTNALKELAQQGIEIAIKAVITLIAA